MIEFHLSLLKLFEKQKMERVWNVITLLLKARRKLPRPPCRTANLPTTEQHHFEFNTPCVARILRKITTIKFRLVTKNFRCCELENLGQLGYLTKRWEKPEKGASFTE